MSTEGDLPPLIQERARYFAQSHATPTETETQVLTEEVRRLHSTALAKSADVPPLPSRHLMHAELLALREYLQGLDASPPRFASSITPEDVRNVVFHAVRFQPSYDENEVDDFLDVVEHRVRAGNPPLPGGRVDFAMAGRLRIGYKIEDVDRFIERLRRASTFG